MLGFFACAGAQTSSRIDSTLSLTAEKCLAEAPFEVLPLLGRNVRLDMIDYYHAGSDRESTNDLGGTARITSLTPESITMDYGTGAKMQIFVLDPDSRKPLIGVIETLDSPIADSSMRLFNSRWEPQPGAPEPRLADWLATKDKADRALAEEALPYIQATYAYDPATGILTITNNMAAYFALGEGDKVMAKLKPELRYKWTGSQFKPAK